MTFPESHLDLFRDSTRAYLFLATLMSDGSPQVTPVWFNTEDGLILINTNEGRVKDKNLKARPQVAMAIQDPSDPFRYIQIRGKVAEYTREKADAHINTLSLKYRGEPWSSQPGQRRIIFKIRPFHFDAH